MERLDEAMGASSGAASAAGVAADTDSRLIVGSSEWQYQQWVEMLHSRDDLLEMIIRSMAKLAVENPKTYKGGMYFPYLPRPRFDDKPNGSMVDLAHKVIFLRLDHKLHNYPEAATLIAEKILRHHLDNLRAQDA